MSSGRRKIRKGYREEERLFQIEEGISGETIQGKEGATEEDRGMVVAAEPRRILIPHKEIAREHQGGQEEIRGMVVAAEPRRILIHQKESRGSLKEDPTGIEITENTSIARDI